jgi:hypothetical protein
LPGSFFLLLSGVPFLSGCPHWLLPPLEVLSCSLDDGGVRVLFSVPPTEISIHKAFSMTEDGEMLEGRFFFEAEELRFYPVNGIGENREYTVTIGTIAEDRRGNSLETEFRRDFFTKAEREAPGITAIFPADESTLAEEPAEIRLYFSEAIDPPSLEEALRISPGFPYAIRWEADHRELVIKPLKPLAFGKRYTITISTALRDQSRNSMVLPFISSFLLGDGRVLPCFDLGWTGAAGNGTLESGVVSTGLPLDAELSINFDRDVAIESLASFVEIQPSLGISIKTEKDSHSAARVCFSRRPEWGRAYTLIIRKGIAALQGGATAEDLSYHLVFDAPGYMPPDFLRGFFRDTGHVLSADTDFGYLNLDVGEFPPTSAVVPADLCLVFAIPEAASSLSLSSAMTAFSINSSNSCAHFSIKTLKVLDEAAYRLSAFNDPSLEAGAGEQICALIYGLEVENTEENGLIVFSIASSLADSLGNTLEKDIKITWNKL